VRALVTGSEGFMGRHFVQALDNVGYDVLGIDVRAPKPMDCRKFFRKHDDISFDLVVHCAAVIPDRDHRERHPLVNAENVELDAAMFQYALRSRARQVVYMSSCAVYPLGLTGRAMAESDLDLKAPATPDGLYGWEKLTGEKFAEAARKDGLKVLVVRPFSGYGTDQSRDYPFPAMIRRARKRRDPFAVWGDGHQVRDFVHVDDVIAAVMVGIRDKLDGPYNIGTGRATSMFELAYGICRAAGYLPRITAHPEKPAGARWRVADTSNQLHEPKVTLEEGIARALRGR